MFPPPLELNEKSEQNGGKMDLYTLVIAKSFGEPKTGTSINEERAPQQEAPLPPIDFSLLAEVRRGQCEEADREGRYVAGEPIRATA